MAAFSLRLDLSIEENRHFFGKKNAYKQGAVAPIWEPSFLFQNLSSYNLSNQQAKFDKNLGAGSISLE